MRRFGRSPTPLPVSPCCDQVGQVLQAFIDGELGPEDAELVAEHLEHCVRCDIETRTIEQVVAGIRRQRPDLDTTVVERLGRFVDELVARPPTG